MPENSALLIGIDGGATEAKSHAVRVVGAGEAATFELMDLSASRKYERVPGFTPVPVGEQIAERNGGAIQVTDGEREQGAKYTDAAAATVVEIAKSAGAASVIIGMGMPGLKTDDGRGINAINNGARTPDFVEQLERKVQAAGIGIAAPIGRLGSDADYCGIGEEFAAEGAFKGVENAYYIGCGTGVADAMKLGGRLVTFDESKSWIQKAWQIASWLGPTFEKIMSANSMMTLYANLEGTTSTALVDAGRFPQDQAAQGDALAQAVLATVSATLAEAIFERLHTVFAGRQEIASRGEAHLALTANHPHRGTLLDRVVIGQRFGAMWAEEKYRSVFRRPTEDALIALAKAAGNSRLRDHIVADGKVRDGLLVPSRLREAPAIGAAIDGYRASMA